MKLENAAAIALFANILGIDASRVKVDTLYGAIFNSRFFTFVEKTVADNGKHIHLDVQNRMGFAHYIDNDSHELGICRFSQEFSEIKRGCRVVFVMPTDGNSSPVWASVASLEQVLDEEFIQVSKENFRQGKKVGKTIIIGMYSRSRVESSATGEFLDHPSPHEYYHRYSFAMKKLGDETWTPIKNPYGLTGDIPTESTLVEKVEEATKSKSVSEPGVNKIRTALDIALERASKYAA